MNYISKVGQTLRKKLLSNPTLRPKKQFNESENDFEVILVLTGVESFV